MKALSTSPSAVLDGDADRVAIGGLLEESQPISATTSMTRQLQSEAVCFMSAYADP